MMRQLCFIIIYAVLFCQTVCAQTTRFGIQGGLNSANALTFSSSASLLGTSVVRPVISGYAEIEASSLLFLQLGLSYTQKGTEFSVGTFSTAYRFAYLEIPILFKVKFLESAFKPYLLGGVVSAFTLAAGVESVVNGQRLSGDVRSLAGDVDFLLEGGGGIEYQLSPNFSVLVDARYSFGLQNLLKEVGAVGAQNIKLQARDVKILGGLLFCLW